MAGRLQRWLARWDERNQSWAEQRWGLGPPREPGRVARRLARWDAHNQAWADGMQENPAAGVGPASRGRSFLLLERLVQAVLFVTGAGALVGAIVAAVQGRWVEALVAGTMGLLSAGTWWLKRAMGQGEWGGTRR